jgi:epoxyqueuosine reductase
MSRKKMKDRYRRFPAISDWGGIKSAIGELRGMGYPKQPELNKRFTSEENHYDEGWFIRTIKDKIANHPENSMEYPFYGERIFDEPIIGFIRGDDPIFNDYKKIIGPHHFTPEEIMAWQAEKSNVPAPKAEELSVVSFVMPITRQTKKDNAAATEWPAERWAQTRMHGEMFSQLFVREIVTDLMTHGVLAIAPDVTPIFNKKRYPNVGWASPWSHRHIAYAAGLGTFGMHDFLITEKGCAHRLGSFVVNRKLEPNRNRPDDIHAYCLQYQNKNCMACMKRCPVDAISEENAHDKEICYKKVANSTKHCLRNYRMFIYGCGLCATRVPCESGIPKQLRP